MATTLLTTGVSNSIAQTTSYALPAIVVHLQSTVAVELSPDGSTWALVTASTTGVQTAAVAVRCTTAPAIVTIKRL
jgi:hypothetical protein